MSAPPANALSLPVTSMTLPPESTSPPPTARARSHARGRFTAWQRPAGEGLCGSVLWIFFPSSQFLRARAGDLAATRQRIERAPAGANMLVGPEEICRPGARVVTLGEHAGRIGDARYA